MTLPTRSLTIVVDPFSVDELLHPDFRGALLLVGDLAAMSPPLSITFVVPAYLAEDWHIDLAKEYLGQASTVDAEPPGPLTLKIPRRLREPIERGAEGDCRGLRLIHLSHHLHADGLITDLPTVLAARYELNHQHGVRVVPLTELPDVIEVFARGHGLPCSADVPRWLSQDILYAASHWKGRRLFEWFNRVSPRLDRDPTLRELLRSALLNRYAFILHARDMVKFYQLQRAHSARRLPAPDPSASLPFRGLLNFHLTAFYFHIWGMLDTLAGIATRRLGLPVAPRRSQITGDDFLQALRVAQPALHAFVKGHQAEWVSVLGHVRHPIAHSALRMQQDLVTPTPESQISDEAVLAILKTEKADLYATLPPDLMQAMEPMLIYQWRLSKMRLVSDDTIHIEESSGGYFRSPVASLDFDLERINAFIDAFLIGCFNTGTASSTGSPPSPQK